MKASPSSPPPPPPVPEPADGSGTEPTAGADAAPATPASAVQATWPIWHRNADVFVALLIVVTAFLTASFTARNSDFFRHIAGGRLIAKGQYPIGGDPFSYTAAERPWVNANWLYDLGFYLLYRAESTGAIAVVVKAFAFAAAIAFLFVLRRPAQSIWPWTLLVGLALLAIAGHATLRPIVFGLLFQVLTLAALYRLRWDDSKWRAPLLLGGLFLIWTNTDSFAFLGPLTVLLVLIGEAVHAMILPAGDKTPDDVFYPAPSRSALLRALAVGTVAFLLNPTFLGGLARNPAEAAAQLLPFELSAKPALMEKDLELLSHGLSPLDDRYFKEIALGNNLGGWMTMAVLVLSLLAMSLGYTRLRATHLLLWLVFGLLAAQHYRFLPFLILVMAPITAAHINGLTNRMRLGKTDDQITRLLLTGSGVLRILTLAMALLLVALAIPGYLQTPSASPVYARRVAWNIEVDQGLAHGVERLQTLRMEGRLPAKKHGLDANTDFADYAAWFAPSERSFINSRFRFHRLELEDLLKFRAELRAGPTLMEQVSRDTDIPAIMDKYQAEYVCLGRVQTQLNVWHLQKIATDLTISDTSPTPFWFLNGRSAILGRADTPEREKFSNSLRMNIARQTFGPQASTLPTGTSQAPPAVVDSWLVEYLDRPEPGSVEADESLFYTIYAQILQDKLHRRWVAHVNQNLTATGAIAGSMLYEVRGQSIGLRFPTEDEIALPIAAARAARRAIAKNPDHREGYFALAQAYLNPHMPSYINPIVPELEPNDNSLQELTAINRYLARCPTGNRITPSNLAAREQADQVLQKSMRAANILLRPLTRQRPPAFDAASLIMQTAAKYLPICDDTQLPSAEQIFELRGNFLLFGRAPNTPLNNDADLRALQKLPDPAGRRTILDRLFTQFADRYKQGLEALDNKYGRHPLPQRVAFYISEGFPLTGVNIAKEGFQQKTISMNEAQMYAELIDLQMRLGRLEIAAMDLKELDDVTRRELDTRADDPVLQSLRYRVNHLEGMRGRFEGDFPLAARTLEDQVGRRLPRLTPQQLELLKQPATSRPHLLGAVVGAPLDMYKQESTNQVFKVIVSEGIYHYSHGVLALLDGDVATARTSFERSLKPQGIDALRTGLPYARQASIYFSLLDKYKSQDSQASRDHQP